MLEVRRQTILIHGVPRSGTSWLGQIFNSHEAVAYRFQPLFSHAFKDRLGPDASAETIAAFLDDVLATDDPFVLGRSPEIHGSYPLFEKAAEPTHLAIKHVRHHQLLEGWLGRLEGLKAIAIVRHPCAVLHSWFNAPREFPPQWDRFEQWRWAPAKNEGRPGEFNGFERWKEAATLFLRLSRQRPRQLRLIRYGDLLAAPRDEADALFQWVGLEPTEQSVAFIRDSTSRNDPGAYAVHKVKAGDDAWKTGLPRTIADAVLSDLEDTELERFIC